MHNWTSLLQNAIPPHCYYCPFTCRNGFPDADDVIIIGQKEATNLDRNWWDWWNTESGFDYERFRAYYLDYRRTIGKRRMESDTRRCLNRIHDSGINAVNTNACYPEVIKLLIDNMTPKAIVAHGNDAKDLVARFQSQEVITLPDERVIRSKHFSRISYEKLDSICATISGL